MDKNPIKTQLTVTPAQVATVLRLRLVAKPNKLPPGGYRPAPVQEILAKLRRS
jgi:hypothetical protein